VARKKREVRGPAAVWSEPSLTRCQDGEDEESDEEDEEADAAAAAAAGVGGGRAAAVEEEKPRVASATEGLIEVANPNAPKAASRPEEGAAPELTRRERRGERGLRRRPRLTRRSTAREALEKQRAEERHWKLTQQGKTDEAVADLARLALVRAERAAAAEAKAAAKAEEAARGGKVVVKAKK